MDLDLYEKFTEIDQGDMLGAIRELPDQLIKAYHQGSKYPLAEVQGIERIVIAGMGGSAIGGDLIAAYVKKDLLLPLVVLRDYTLPGWAKDRKCLVVCSSHSGNTEETNSVLNEAIEKNCSVVAITTGGNLHSTAKAKGVPVWKYNHLGQPRAAIGWSFGLLLKLFERLSFIQDQSASISTTTRAMEIIKDSIDAHVQVVNNSAKRLAGQLVGRIVTVFGAEHLSPVARRWKTQINELAKCWGQYEFIPEADHNTLAGVLHPPELLSKFFSVFLLSEHYHPRNQKRMALTFSEMMVAGIGTDKIDLPSEDKLSEIWTSILFGDFCSYYLAMLYDIDPTPVDAIESLKLQMK